MPKLQTPLKHPVTTEDNFDPVKFRKALREAVGILSDEDSDRIKNLRKNWNKRIKELWGE